MPSTRHHHSPLRRRRGASTVALLLLFVETLHRNTWVLYCVSAVGEGGAEDIVENLKILGGFIRTYRYIPPPQYPSLLALLDSLLCYRYMGQEVEKKKCSTFRSLLAIIPSVGFWIRVEKTLRVRYPWCCAWFRGGFQAKEITRQARAGPVRFQRARVVGFEQQL
jgi:hypothetical protein